MLSNLKFSIWSGYNLTTMEQFDWMAMVVVVGLVEGLGWVVVRRGLVKQKRALVTSTEGDRKLICEWVGREINGVVKRGLVELSVMMSGELRVFGGRDLTTPCSTHDVSAPSPPSPWSYSYTRRRRQHLCENRAGVN